MLVVKRVEERFDVHLVDPAAHHLHQAVPQLLECPMSRPPRPIGIRAVQKVLFVDRSQHHRHRDLKDFVLERRDAQGPLGSVCLRYVGAPYRRCPVTPALGPLFEPVEILLQVLSVLFCRLMVDPSSPVLPRPFVRFQQELNVDVMRQGFECFSPVPSCQFCYPIQSRADGSGVLCLCHLSPPRFRLFPASRFPPPGPIGFGSPFSSVLPRCSVTCCPSGRASFPSLGSYLGWHAVVCVRRLLSRPPPVRLVPSALVARALCLSGCPFSPLVSVEASRLPRFVGRPLLACPALATPADFRASPLSALPCCLPL